MTMQCELCELPARMFCESDQASLCWECDAKVHGANFLVARHSRRLLCRSCQAPTPWRASGSRLGSTVSVCSRCLGDNGAEASDCGETTGDGGGEAGGGGGRRRGGLMEGNAEGSGDTDEEEDDDSEEDDDEEEEEDDEEDEDGDGDGDNQVVPWSTEAGATETASPPPAASCSSSEESSSGRAGVYYGFLKRRMEEDDHRSSHWQEDTGCSPPQHGGLRFSAPAAAYPGRMLVDEDDGKEAPHLGCSFESRITAVRPRPGPAGRPTPPRPRLWRRL